MDIKINEDLLMNYFLFAAAEKTVFEDWCPYHYIVRGASASRVKLNEHKIYDPIKVKEIICKDAPPELHDTAWQAYLNTCINTYHTLLSSSVEYRKDLSYVRDLIIEKSSCFSMLGKKRKLMASMIVHVPGIYRLIYAAYNRFFQKNIYN